MKRRNFIKNSAVSGIVMAGLGNAMGASASQTASSDAEKFKLNYAPHFGMFRHSAGNDLIDQLKFMADQGFTAFEDNGMTGRDTATQTKIGETLEKLGMTMGVFVVPKGGNLANTLAAGKKEHLDIFLEGCRQSVEVAKRVNAKWMTVVPGSFERNLP
ncbi:MAG: xylose isomerase, partial [Tangfeifania sp.]